MEHLSTKRKVTIMIAVMAAMLFASINQTIVGTALPRIIAKLGGMEFYSWVFTIYMLTSSVTTILAGRLSDLYGRKPFLLFGVGIFLIGAFLSGTSTTIIQLILYRGIQGIGSGLIMSAAFSAVGDLFAPRERGRWTGYMSAIFGFSSVLGPVMGGYIVDRLDWHWIFWIFLPLGIVAFVMIWMMFPSVPHSESEHVDYWGSLLLTVTVVPLLLVLSWGGSQYAWSSPPILGMIAIALIALLLFLFVENRAENPVIPLQLFKSSVFTISNMSAFTMSVGMFGAIMYMPFFVQGVLGQTATHSSFIMIPLTLSLVIGSMVSGQLITRTGSYKWLALTGLFLTVAGIWLMSRMTPETTTAHIVWNNILTGVGLGLGTPVFSLTVQNAVKQSLLGVATASTQFFRSLGGTVGVSVMGTVMAHRMSSKAMELFAGLGDLRTSQVMQTAQVRLMGVNPELDKYMSQLQNPQVLLDAAKLEQLRSSLPPELRGMFSELIAILRESLSYSLSGVFLTGALVVFFAFLLTFFLKEVPLRGSATK
ncbi:MDR family MFS transporter [Brevibacillus fluminis]|uniref:MDR family MFS transporter n=1 Tax=Brevibacillus fluminis TaxID=511487 RepID=UPI003F8BEDAA